MAGFDLHMHSIYSDGSLVPAELAKQAAEIGLEGFALTDHDSVDGQEEAEKTAKLYRVLFIPGVEITTDYGNKEAHILGYNIDYRLPELTAKFETILTARVKRAKQIIAKLNRHRVPLTWEMVAGRTNGRFVGRPHIFKAMEAMDLVDPLQRNAYFDYYLGQNGVAYVPHQEIETAEAIRLILKAGGIPVLAHPGRNSNEAFIADLVGYGLKGLEVYYPSHTSEMVKFYLGLAERYHLYATGGSDYHGDMSHATMGEAVAPALGWLK
jgi:predicted metal-dependent phosphoesterase TrpH